MKEPVPANPPQPVAFDLRRQRAATIAPIAIAFPVAIALWLGTYFLLPPLAGMADMVARVAFAVKCSCIAVLFCLVTGVEAVAHERLRSPAIDPLLGYETRRLRINLRYLQNTLEQLVVFVPGLLGRNCSTGLKHRSAGENCMDCLIGI